MRDKSKYGLSAMVPGELQMLLESKDDEIERLQAEVRRLSKSRKRQNAARKAERAMRRRSEAILGAVRALPEKWRTTPLGNVIAQHCASVCADELEAKLKEAE